MTRQDDWLAQQGCFRIARWIAAIGGVPGTAHDYLNWLAAQWILWSYVTPEGREWAAARAADRERFFDRRRRRNFVPGFDRETATTEFDFWLASRFGAASEAPATRRAALD